MSFESELLPFVDFFQEFFISDTTYGLGPETFILYMQILLKPVSLITGFFVSDYKEQARSGPKDFPRYKHILL